jgi:hypothetical protein
MRDWHKGAALCRPSRQSPVRAPARADQAVFASFSAAHWLAPYGRSGTEYFYADESGLKRLEAVLTLSSAAKGENVVDNDFGL